MSSSSNLPRCEICTSRQTRWSRTSYTDYPLLLVARPIRCGHCYGRFWQWDPVRTAAVLTVIGGSFIILW